MGPALVQISAITFGQLNFVKCLSRPSPDVPGANPGLQGGESTGCREGFLAPGDS